jgi:Zn-dependent peptidase ImmA (M78 family)
MSEPISFGQVPYNESVEVMGYRFTVVATVDDKLDGDSSVTERMIRINSTRTPEVQVETFYHELAHIILTMTGHDNVLKKSKEESIATVIGMGMASAILNNKNLPGMRGTQ